METIDITCTNNGKTKRAEVLNRNDKYMKVVFEGTTITLELFRADVNRPYIGNKSGLEFTWNEKN